MQRFDGNLHHYQAKNKSKDKTQKIKTVGANPDRSELCVSRSFQLGLEFIPIPTRIPIPIANPDREQDCYLNRDMNRNFKIAINRDRDLVGDYYLKLYFLCKIAICYGSRLCNCDFVSIAIIKLRL